MNVRSQNQQIHTVGKMLRRWKLAMCAIQRDSSFKSNTTSQSSKPRNSHVSNDGVTYGCDSGREATGGGSVYTEEVWGVGLSKQEDMNVELLAVDMLML